MGNYRLVSSNQSPNLKSKILILCSIRITFKLARGQNGTCLDPSTFEGQYYFLRGTNISPMTWSVHGWHTRKLARLTWSCAVFHSKRVYHIQAERRSSSLFGNQVPNEAPDLESQLYLSHLLPGMPFLLFFKTYSFPSLDNALKSTPKIKSKQH